MTTLITRMYADRATADAAAQALLAAEFQAKEFDVITAADAPVAKRLGDARVFASTAKVYAERLSSGGAVLVIRAPLGESAEARAIADRFNPMYIPMKRAEGHLRSREPRLAYGPSSTMLLTNDARFFDWIPDIARGQVMGFIPSLFRGGLFSFIPPLFSGRLTSFMPLLSGGPRKTKLITDRTTPFSSLFGLPLLTRTGPVATGQLAQTGPLVTGHEVS